MSAGFTKVVAKDQRGVSIVESIVAGAIVTGVALTTAFYFYSQLTAVSRIAESSNCTSVLGTAMGNLKARGLITSAFVYTNNGARAELPSTVVSAGISDPIRRVPFSSAGTLIEDDPSNPAPVTLHLPVLLDGTMGSLTALYNSNPDGYCVNPSGAPLPDTGATSILPTAITTRLSNFQGTMRIQPYDLRTGLPTGNCRTPLIPRPASRFEPPLALTGTPGASGPPMFRLPPQYDANVGYIVTMSASFTDKTTGNVRRCQIEERFQYPVDRDVAVLPEPFSAPIVSPADTDVRNRIPPASFPNRAQCSHGDGTTPGRFTLTLGFRARGGLPALEPGSIMLCRDVSVVHPGVQGGWCNHSSATGARMTASSIPTLNPSTSPWVPCSRVTACGVAPDSTTSTFSMGSDYRGDSYYTLNYDSTRLWGCDVRIQYAAVDAAGNAQLASTSPSFLASGVSADVMGIYFQPPPCYRCVQRRRGGFFGRLLCFVAVNVGVGQRGGCKGRVSFRCNGQNPGRRTTCTEMPIPRPDWINAVPKRAFAPTSGYFTELTPPRPWRIPTEPLPDGGGPAPQPASVPHGEEASGVYVDETTGVSCETMKVCDDGQWVDLDEPGDALCSQAYTKMELVNNVPTPKCVTEVPMTETVITSPFDGDGNYARNDWCTAGPKLPPAGQTPLPDCSTLPGNQAGGAVVGEEGQVEFGSTFPSLCPTPPPYVPSNQGGDGGGDGGSN